ncbi:phosphate/phosphite/phosphonate ABC transporter substrate-binding protein [Chitinimonas koreensis]|uniref:phosphate/phosphite/phosphonate ABC transporter substrate-binding protein n=1 Tax=Chitinimonas koreensis TaxID=356302 RepID=UPI0003FB644F|nr:PhnD/SsuA/transferrin family substrate-binding protein [Chitinimonas koreensis]QNM96006.1 phosphate/phosphite/phosphonate ABC transporter substrate-binding protein [Chitinimonas koreensis]
MEWKRKLILALLAGLGLVGTVHADKGPLCLAVSEGSSGQGDIGQVKDKYRPLGEELGRALERPVKIRVLSYGALLQTLRQGECELVYTRTAYIAGWAIRDAQYKLMAANTGSKQVVVIAPAGNRYASVRDLRGKRVAMPDLQSDLSRVLLAMLRDAGLKPDDLHVQTTSQQDSIIFGLDSQLSDAGVLTSNSKAAREWAKKGGLVALKSRPLPNWSFLASPKVGDDGGKLQQALLGLNQSAAGRKALQEANLDSLVEAKPADYVAVVDWVGAPG